MKGFRWLIGGLSLICLAVWIVAQPATPEQRGNVQPPAGVDYATLHFRTNLGSFRLIDGEGRVTFRFRGTVLLNQLDGTYQVTGNVQEQYRANDRVVLFGNGEIVVQGNWRAIHWFGSDLQAVWFGRGIARLSGEFDRNQETGEYWFNDPNDVSFWPGEGVIEVPLPPIQFRPTDVVPRPRQG